MVSQTFKVGCIEFERLTGNDTQRGIELASGIGTRQTLTLRAHPVYAYSAVTTSLLDGWAWVADIMPPPEQTNTD